MLVVRYGFGYDSNIDDYRIMRIGSSRKFEFISYDPSVGTLFSAQTVTCLLIKASRGTSKVIGCFNINIQETMSPL